MADKKITELPNITGADLANADEFAVVDITASQTKAITFGELKTAVGTDFVSKAGSTMTGSLVLNADPTASLQAASKQYVDTIAAAGLHYHDPCRVESSSNLTVTYNNGTAGVGATLTNNSTQVALVLDGVTLSSGNRVLVKGQTAQAQNGVYTVTNTGSGSTNWVLTRATDADSYGPSDPDSFGQGDAFFVEEGNTGAGNLDVMNTVGVITFGTTAIVFVNVSASAVYSAGTGVTLTGTQFSIGQAVATTSTPTFGNTTINGTANMDGLTVANTGVPVILIQDTDGTNQKTFLQQSNGANIISAQDGVSHGRTLIRSYNGTNTVERLRVDANGDISFYEDTGNTAKFFWDASAEKLGIGTSTPSAPVTIKSSSTSGSTSGLLVEGNSNTNTVVAIGEKSTDGGRFHMYDGGVEKIALYTDGTANHISAGNVGIGNNNPSEKLDVTGNIVASGSIIADNIGSGSLAPVSPSGTSAVNFTSIPAGVRQVTVMLEQLSLNNNDDLLIQLGDSGGIETSGYISRCVWSGGLESTLGMVIDSNAVTKWTGAMTFTRVHTTNRFVQTHTVIDPDQNEQRVGAGSKTLSGELTQLRVVPTGSNTFDNGSVSIAWSY